MYTPPKPYLFYIACGVLIIAILFIASFMTYQLLHDDDPDDQWDTFADEINYYTEFNLKAHENDTYGWGATPGYIRLLGDSSSVSITCGRTNDYTSKYYTYYSKIYVDDDCLRIEYHSSRYTTDGSDAVISVSYIPYSSILYVQANKVR